MIKERMGMRVCVIEDFGTRYSKGDKGTITRVDGDGCPQVSVDGKGVRFISDYRLTEIKESDMKKGDLVVMAKEGSYYKNGDICRLLYCDGGNDWWAEAVKTREDSWLNETCIGDGYFMKLKKQPIPKVKEVTAEQMMRDLKEKYGCEVKVIK
jgi:hypothetical protein